MEDNGTDLVTKKRSDIVLNYLDEVVINLSPKELKSLYEILIPALTIRLEKAEISLGERQDED